MNNYLYTKELKKVLDQKGFEYEMNQHHDIDSFHVVVFNNTNDQIHIVLSTNGSDELLCQYHISQVPIHPCTERILDAVNLLNKQKTGLYSYYYCEEDHAIYADRRFSSRLDMDYIVTYALSIAKEIFIKDYCIIQLAVL